MKRIRKVAKVLRKVFVGTFGARWGEICPYCECHRVFYVVQAPDVRHCHDCRENWIIGKKGAERVSLMELLPQCYKEENKKR